MKQRSKTSLILVRVTLLLLILANMAFIFYLSHQDGKQSGETSKQITESIVQSTVKDFEEKTSGEKTKIIADLDDPVRNLAHMAEFGTLGALVLLFLLTWQGLSFVKYLGSIAFTFLYSCVDEWHQKMVGGGRAAEWTDVLIDTFGALICCTLVLLIYWITTRKRRKKVSTVKTTRYFLQSQHKDLRLCLAVASDLHGMGYEKVLEILKREKPDLILIPGDLMEDKKMADPTDDGYDFLRECAAVAPTYYSYGNHEIGCYHKGKPWTKPTPKPLPPEVRDYVAETGAILLDNESKEHGILRICGLTSGLNGKINQPDLAVLESFDKSTGFRILLCHHPEYFMPYIRQTGIELTVSGHAHGGQWRLFGRGAFAPGQGIFPKYTSGVLENRCVISRGIGNHTCYPRIFNTPEVVMIYYGYDPSEIHT